MIGPPVGAWVAVELVQPRVLALAAASPADRPVILAAVVGELVSASGVGGCVACLGALASILSLVVSAFRAPRVEQTPPRAPPRDPPAD